jgi:hypothetical protein
MSNEKVILAFLEGKKAHTPTRDICDGVFIYKGQTLQTDGEKLINYSTKIAYKKDGVVYLNVKKYSQTTSKIQSLISYLAGQKNMIVVEYMEG